MKPETNATKRLSLKYLCFHFNVMPSMVEMLDSEVFPDFATLWDELPLPYLLPTKSQGLVETSGSARKKVGTPA